MGVSVPPKLVLFMDVSVPHNFQVNQRTKTIFIKGNMLLKLSDNLFLFLTSCFSGSYLHFNLHSGAIGDCLVRRKEVAQHFLAIHNSSEQYKKWAKLSMKDNDRLFLNGTTEQLTSSGLHMKHKNQIPTDHTQVSVIYFVHYLKARLMFFSVWLKNINCILIKITQQEKERKDNERIEPKQMDWFPVKICNYKNLETNKGAKNFKEIVCISLEVDLHCYWSTSEESVSMRIFSLTIGIEMSSWMTVPYVHLFSSFPMIHVIDEDWLKQIA